MNTTRSRPLPLRAALALAAGLLASCVSQPIPVHGGGKRFFYEQEVLTAAFDDALGQIDVERLAPLKGKTVHAVVVSMGDEGGGIEPEGGALSLFGLGASAGFAGSSGVVGGSLDVPTGGGAGHSHAFANARDIQYVAGRVRQFLAAHDIALVDASTESSLAARPTVYFLISQFGTSKSGFNLLVYREAELAARADLEAFAYGLDEPDGSGPAGYRALGGGACTATYRAAYLLGYGPLRGAEITLQPGDLPVRRRRLPPVAAAEEVQL